MQLEVSMKLKCLLVKLPDGRKFFTTKNNHTQLLEFARVFKTKLEVVDAYDPELLSLKDLAASISDQTKVTKPTMYETKRTKEQDQVVISHYTSFSNLSTRQKLLKKVGTIRDYILSQFNAGKPVKIKDIAKKFDKHGVSVSTVYRHVNHVKEMLEAQNRVVVKVSPGVYKMEKAG
jgi:hypothetical protein